MAASKKPTPNTVLVQTRIPPVLHDQLEDTAARDGTSVAAFVRRLIMKSVRDEATRR